MVTLVTGAGGFIGSALCTAMQKAERKVRPAFRSASRTAYFPDSVVAPGLGKESCWYSALQGVDVVVHIAGVSSTDARGASDALHEFRMVNVEGTAKLARQAAALGVRRFIFVSSIKVHGESTALGCSFKSDDVAAPLDAYGISKVETELELRKIAKEYGMELTIIRPPAVYGPGMRGNLATLVRWIDRGFPIPLGAITDNRRSFVSIDNLVSLLIRCLDHPLAANQAFLVSDGEDLSTADFIKRVAKAMNRRPLLISFPCVILELFLTIFGLASIMQRLRGSLQIDMTKTCVLLDWAPPLSVDQALDRMVI